MNTNIIRTKTLTGITIPAFINNANFYFTDLGVYEDGVIDCWQITDLAIFKEKLKKGWVKTAVPDQDTIHVFDLGNWKITNSKWLYTAESLYDHVYEKVKEMNPFMDNLYQYTCKMWNGIPYEERVKGTFAKEESRFENDPFPNWLKGDHFELFYKEKDIYYLTRIVLFSNETIQLQRLPQTIELTIEQLDQYIKEGKLVTEVPEGAFVEIYGLGSFTIASVYEYPVTIEEKRAELDDMLSKLNHKPTTLEICRKIMTDYLEHPTTALKEKLKTAYENIPEHHRMYVGDMDTKDVAVRMILYGEEEIENWSHYAVSKALDMELPSITVPKPKDEDITEN